MAKYSTTDGQLDTSFTPGQISGDTIEDHIDFTRGTILGSAGDIYIGGMYEGSADVDPDDGAAVSLPTATDGHQSFVLHLDAAGNYLNHWHTSATTILPAGLFDDTLYVSGPNRDDQSRRRRDSAS